MRLGTQCYCSSTYVRIGCLERMNWFGWKRRVRISTGYPYVLARNTVRSGEKTKPCLVRWCVLYKMLLPFFLNGAVLHQLYSSGSVYTYQLLVLNARVFFMFISCSVCCVRVFFFLSTVYSFVHTHASQFPCQ